MPSINRTIRTCTWILTSATRTTPATYCGRPVGYTMPNDEDGNRTRSYDTLCLPHQLERVNQISAIKRGIADGTLDPDDYDFIDDD